MEELLLKIKKFDVRLSVENNNLKLSVPEGFQDNGLIEDIKENKNNLIKYINAIKKDKWTSRAIPRSMNSDITKLTPPQARLYVLHGFAEKSNVYNIPFACELKGIIDIPKLQKAFRELIQRHESLRTCFLLDKDYQPVQKVLEDFDFSLEFEKSNEKGLEKIMNNFSRAFNLEKGLLLRVKLVEVGVQHSVLLIDVHHIVFDGISMQVFLDELMSLYNNKELGAPALQYKDYASWYHSEEYQKNLSGQKRFWLEELKDYSNTAVLPSDFKKSNNVSFKGAYLNFTIKGDRRRYLKELAKSSESSLFSILMCFYSLLQAKLTGVDDLAIGTPVAGRGHWDLEKVIGMFVNTLAIRMKPKGELNFIAYLKEVSTSIARSFDHQEYPVEKLLEDLGMERTTEINPLFNTLISFDNIKQVELSMKGLELKPIQVKKATSKFDLMIHFSEKEDELNATFEYNTQLFKKDTIERFFDYFINIIDQVQQNETITLNKIMLLNATSRENMLLLNDFTDIEFPDELTLIEVFERQVLNTPNKVALFMGTDTLSYKELNEKANRVARLLRANGVGREDAVGLFMEKNIDVIIGMLGILKAGGGYVPIDVNYPQNRIDYIIENSGVKLILSTKEFYKLIHAKGISGIDIAGANKIEDSSNLDIINKPNDLCYIIYTSGTTGAPKGVMVEHRNVIRLLFNKSFQFDFTEKDVWTMFHNHCFDFSVWEMYGSLLYGGSLVIISPEEAKDPWKFIQILQDFKVTVLNQTPTSFYSLIQESIEKNVNFENLRYVIFGGEALIPSKLDSWRKKHPTTKLINMYGITEVTVHMTYKEIEEEEIRHSTSNIGKALPTGAIYVLDKNMQPVPTGVLGEVYVGGEGVARGYRNNEELTNSRFVKNPFKPGDRLYRSGDLAVLLANGDLAYKMRADNQVQLKGFRIELKEIEHYLCQHQEIENATVHKRLSENQEPYLCAYYLGTKELEVAALRSYLEKKLPAYMIPSFYVKIKEIPYTINNKIDFNKLPEPIIGMQNTYVAATNKEELSMIKIWQNFMNIPHIGLLDNFFNLGGDSLRAIGLVSTINEELSSSLVIADIYAHPTIKDLVKVLKSKKGKEYKRLKKEAERELRLFQNSYKQNKDFLPTYDEVYPMNGVEKGMVFHSLLGNSDNVHNILYHEQNMYALPDSDFDFEVFKQALNLIVKKHSELRKIYDLENLAHIILKEITPEVHFINLSHLTSKEQELYIAKKSKEEKLKETNLSMSLIWRIHIFKVHEDFHYLLFDFNHSLLDGWSLSSFITELNNTIKALKKDRNYIPKQIQGSYKDQILGELIAINNQESHKYWKKELTGYNRFELPSTGLPHKIIDNTYNIGKEYRTKLEGVAYKLNTSFKHLCFAAIIYALRRISYESDITLGIVTNIRPLIPDAENLVGCFLNTIPFRVQIPENITWREYIDYVEGKLKELKYHERVPFYKILDIIGEKTLDGNPIFDVKLNYIDFRVFNELENYNEENKKDYFGLSDEDKSYVNENTPLNFHVLAHDDDFILRIVHSESFLEEEQSKKLYTYIKSTLDLLLKDPDAKQTGQSILTEDEYLQLTKEFNDTEVSFEKDTTILDVFANQVKLTPNKIATVFEKTSLTYQQLNEKSNQLAHKLIEAGIKPGSMIPIGIERSHEMIIGILGIMKAGGAYVPVDPTYPKTRIDYILQDIKSPFILTASKFESQFDIPTLVLDRVSLYERQPKSKPDIEINGTCPAYVIYTSGTTGNPKGVINLHNGIYNRLSWMRNYLGVTPEDIIVQKTSFCFDVSVWELILPLIMGAKLIFAKPGGHKDPNYLHDLIDQTGITIMHFVPSMLSVFIQNIEEFKGNTLQSVICSGEELKLATVKDFQSKLKGVSIHNLYGPTEAAIDVTATDVTSYQEGKISIGKPIANTQIYIVDSAMNIQPIGAKGELLIGGIQVAKGYLNKSELTSEKFITNPFDKKDQYKLYRSGDMARWLPSGDIEYLGRIDSQIKLRGNRIELGEIEANLLTHPKIGSAAVDHRMYHGTFCLIAYFVKNTTESLQIDQLKTYLKEEMPDYMIPAYFEELKELPITTNGKLDRSALPDPEIVRLESHVNPANETEEQLLKIWSEILSIDKEKISTMTSFFDIGGNSLRAVSLVNALHKEFSVNMDMSKVFAKQHIKNMADYIITVQQMDMEPEEDEQEVTLMI